MSKLVSYSPATDDKPLLQGYCYVIVTCNEDGSNQHLWRSFRSACEAKQWLLNVIYDYTGRHMNAKGPFSFTAPFLIPSRSFIACIPIEQAKQQIYVR